MLCTAWGVGWEGGHATGAASVTSSGVTLQAQHRCAAKTGEQQEGGKGHFKLAMCS